MPIGQFAENATTTASSCTTPLLDESQFGTTGGYQSGRYCGLGSFEDGTTCCFPCPIQDWVYPAKWKEQLRIPNYLSILSVILCSFLLLSFAVLPPSQTHRHYLSVGLLFPVLFISLSFVIPVGIDPPTCYDAITPHDMRSNLSCAWTGSLVTLGGLGCVVWVFLRSLWLHVRIFWDRDPGRNFKYASILVGTLLPLSFLIALLVATGFSYRMGQTCLPNHQHAIVTFWVWLVVFAIAGFLLQAITTGYCVHIYISTIRQERERASITSFQRHGIAARMETWKNVKNLILLQWRNILVSVFVIIGSISFFIVFWTQDRKLGRVFNDSENIKPVKTWIICLTISRGDKGECLKYVKNFTVPRPAVLTSLILASLVGIEIFILLFRRSMITAWKDLFRRLLHKARGERPPTPQLTSLKNPDQYLPTARKPPGAASGFSEDTRAQSSNANYSNSRNSEAIELGESGEISGTLRSRPGFERLTSETGLLQELPRFQSFWDSSAETSRAGTPVPLPGFPESEPVPAPAVISSPTPARAITPQDRERYTPQRDAPTPPRRSSTVSYSEEMKQDRLRHHRNSLPPQLTHASTPFTLTPLSSSQPPRSSSRSSSRSRGSTPDPRQYTFGLSIQKSNSSKMKPRPRIGAPVSGSFVHVGGAFMNTVDEGAAPVRSRGPLGPNIAEGPVGGWESEEEFDGRV